MAGGSRQSYLYTITPVNGGRQILLAVFDTRLMDTSKSIQEQVHNAAFYDLFTVVQAFSFGTSFISLANAGITMFVHHLRDGKLAEAIKLGEMTPEMVAKLAVWAEGLTDISLDPDLQEEDRGA